MRTDDLRARLTALLDAPGDSMGGRVNLVYASDLRDLLAATDPAPDEALHRSAALREFADFQFGRFGSGHQINMLRLWAEKEARGERIPAETAPTPPTVAPSDLPVATGYQPCSDECGGCPTCDPGLGTGDATSEGDEHDHEWTRCGTCPHPGEPCPCSGSDCPTCPAPVHADDTDATLGAPDELSPSPKSAQTGTGAGDEGVRLTEDEACRNPTCASALIDTHWHRASIAGLLARLAEVTAERDGHRRAATEWAAQSKRDKARADAAEARLGEGVVEWGVRFNYPGIDVMREVTARYYARTNPDATLVTRTVHTSPWVEVSEP